MATYLICSTPVLGHVAPMLGIGRHLVSRGHQVIVLTGSRFADQVTSLGIEFRALSGLADFDDRDLDSHLPDRAKYRGFAQIQYDIQTMFVNTIPAQFAAVRAILEADAPDAILVDSAFVGAAPLLLDGAAVRPAVLGVGVVPLSQSSRDVAPYGMGLAPSSSALGRLRNRGLNLLAAKVLFRKTQRSAERIFAAIGGPPLEQFIMDVSGAYDRFLQLNAREFEYPRSDLAANTSFVGPVLPLPAKMPMPDWWGELDGSRPVVHVTQGTIDNHDLTRLIRPTVEGLADSDVIVVVSTGGRPINDVGPVAPNVRLAEFLPYDLLLPLTDVYVTNGGFGGVQYALSHGVPMVVAGDTEDKPEVAARVSWSGTGINLRTGKPTAEAVRNAAHRVLAEPQFRGRAAEMAEAIAGYSALTSVENALADAIAMRS
ncbi:nucleotide disphospho-sugar-binding domain-containing protein [Lacisediminihabitans sp.]|jgi:MGT family glycosyltransferase|uniref:nucleotide disphospho-sugar-binding domain-containing protein n=1 Tax=Lacisediminihabitans sp. TaxID=2787631 RepID=UPI002F940941